MRIRRFAVSLLFLGMTLAGCSRQGAEQAGQGQSGVKEKSAQTVTARVATISAGHLKAVIEKYRGKVLLIDYWATWCDPCRELFPHTVALSRELADRGLAVVSLSLDDADDEPEVRRFLTANRATFENLRAETGASPESATAFGIEGGAIPFLQLYDRTGKLRKTFPAPVKPAEVEKAVRQLLAEAASAA